jgi:hypothetical protein
MIPGFSIVFVYAVAAILLAGAYFRRVRMARPPLGVINRSDVLIMMVIIVFVPYLYLTLPLWLVGVILGALTTGLLYLTVEPLAISRWGAWLSVLVVVAADLAAWLRFGSAGTPFTLVNDAALTLAAVGVANVWAQSGMKARDAALLGGLLAIYDFLFTARLPLMTDLLTRLATLPFAPQVAWPTGQGEWVGLGLGDLLMVSVFPLVMRKAFSRSAGRMASAISIGVVAVLFWLAGLGALSAEFPMMAVFGPLMILQYVLWTRRRGEERTTWQYVQAEPRASAEGQVRGRGRSALWWPGCWVSPPDDC